jgi:TfoX/Sxy family transcriptional regulator of competence genes
MAREDRSVTQRPDPRMRKLLDALRADPVTAPAIAEFEANRSVGATRKFGSNGLKANGKLFALFTQGTLVVKLPRGRVAELVAQGQGELFDPGHGRLMKEWLTIVDAKASWTGLAKEAHAFVRAAKR